MTSFEAVNIVLGTRCSLMSSNHTVFDAKPGFNFSLTFTLVEESRYVYVNCSQLREDAAMFITCPPISIFMRYEPITVVL